MLVMAIWAVSTVVFTYGWIKVISNLKAEYYAAVFSNSWMFDSSQLKDEGKKYRLIIIIGAPLVFLLLNCLSFWIAD